MISCESIAFSYEGNRVLDNVSFEVSQGDYMCIVGENGSGKSTLMKGLLGLIKPDGGHISYSGIAQSEIGYLPQQTVVQKDFPASVFEIVLSGCLNKKGLFAFYNRQDKRRATQNIERLEMAEFKNKSYRDLSGGQQQRVLLARALCATERLIMLDEPAAGLDPLVTQELYGLLKKLNDGGITVIMISHDIKSAVKYGNKILHLRHKPIFCGSTEDYVKTPIFRIMNGETGGDDVA